MTSSRWPMTSARIPHPSYAWLSAASTEAALPPEHDPESSPRIRAREDRPTGLREHALRAIALASFLLAGALLHGVSGAAAATGPALGGSVANATSLSGAANVAVSGYYAYTTAYYAGTLTVVDLS